MAFKAQDVGKTLEDLVANLFKAKGYKVEKRVKIRGQSGTVY